MDKNKLVLAYQGGVEGWTKNNERCNDLEFEIENRATKHWEEEFARQLATRMKEESGKRDAAIKKKQKRQGGGGNRGKRRI